MPMKLASALLLLAFQALAGEYAILKTGFTLRADRHEAAGDMVRLYVNGGTLDVPAADIARFEQEYQPPATSPLIPAPAPSAKELVDNAARRYGLPASFLHAIARAESGYTQNAVSKKGALGIMQLMPDTARVLGADPKDPKQNVDAGARYIADLLRKYLADDHQVRKAVAAYNAGPGAVDRYDGIPPYRETRQYVEKVVKQYNWGK